VYNNETQNTMIFKINTVPSSFFDIAQLFLIDTLESKPVNVSQIHNWTNQDSALSRVHKLLLSGWTHTTEPLLKPY